MVERIPSTPRHIRPCARINAPEKMKPRLPGLAAAFFALISPADPRDALRAHFRDEFPPRGAHGQQRAAMIEPRRLRRAEQEKLELPRPECALGRQPRNV